MSISRNLLLLTGPHRRRPGGSRVAGGPLDGRLPHEAAAGTRFDAEGDAWKPRCTCTGCERPVEHCCLKHTEDDETSSPHCHILRRANGGIVSLYHLLIAYCVGCATYNWLLTPCKCNCHTHTTALNHSSPSSSRPPRWPQGSSRTTIPLGAGTPTPLAAAPVCRNKEDTRHRDWAMPNHGPLIM